MKYLIALLLFSSSLFAGDEMVEKIFPLYRSGDYFQVLEELEHYRQKKEKLEKVYYWMALSYVKLQEYQNAVAHFKKTVILDDSIKDIYYHYGQALFGIDDIRQAREMFQKSANRKESVSLSYYYVGHISQRLSEWGAAIGAYQAIIEADDGDKELIQSAYYQLGLCKLERAKQTSRAIFSRVRDEVLPMLELAYDEDRLSGLSIKIRESILKLRDEFNLPEKTREVKHVIRFSQGIKFDTNVTLAPGDLSNTPPSNRESLVSNTDLMLKKKMRFLRKTRTTFELNTKYNYHFKRDVGDIYQYDNFSFAPAIRNEWHHQMSKKKFTMLFDIEYGQTHQDYLQEERLPFYNRTISFSLGEKFRLFDAGATMIKLKRKQYYSYTESSNFSTNTLSFFQFVKLRRGNMFLFIFNYDDNNAEVARDSSTNYYFRGDYMVSNFMGPIDLRLGSGVGFLDTQLQSATRGTELMLTPSIELTINFSSKLSMALMFEYTRNFSKDKDLYDYTKQVVGLDLSLNF